MLASQGPWAEFYGSKGVVVSGAGKRPRNEGAPPLQVYQEPLDFDRRGWFKPIPIEAQRWHVGHGVPSFIEAIRDAGERPANSGEHARHVIEIIEKAVELAATGQVCEAAPRRSEDDRHMKIGAHSWLLETCYPLAQAMAEARRLGARRPRWISAILEEPASVCKTARPHAV